MSVHRSSGLAAGTKASAHLFAALGDETRLRIVSRLCDHGPMSTTRLTEGSRITRQAITKHLRLMQDVRLVHSVRQGRERLWELDHHRLSDARCYLDLISQQWDETLTRLRSFVEK